MLKRLGIIYHGSSLEYITVVVLENLHTQTKRTRE